jgi:hypothetical protein
MSEAKRTELERIVHHFRWKIRLQRVQNAWAWVQRTTRRCILRFKYSRRPPTLDEFNKDLKKTLGSKYELLRPHLHYKGKFRVP